MATCLIMDNPFVKALKKVLEGCDGGDIFIFVVLLVVFPPLPLIWLAVRIIQEME
jgi:hypothetical protein